MAEEHSGRTILKFVWSPLGAQVALAIAVVDIWNWETDGAAHRSIGYIIVESLMALGAISILVAAWFGGCGLKLLAMEVVPWIRRHRAKTSLVGLAALNAYLVYAAIWPIIRYTIVGRWCHSIDGWSLANGHGDHFFSVALVAPFWLWPYVPVLLIWRRRGTRIVARPRV